ncbi:adenosine deaminase [Staphylococcus agnetis]|uniref:adenosine deaminase n=1 Tax=Staphylococcus agnetis TaxID=985762 RepID=UPI000D02D656|nr:adenosine deaminase [Staphylococcus agnetis]
MGNKIDLVSIPKVELHCHLDGSVSFEFLKRQSALQNITIDFHKITVGETCKSLDEYLQSFDEILKVMQTAQSLKESVIDVAKQAARDGVKYIEIRFAPSLHTHKEESIASVLQAVCEGAKEAESACNMTIRILVCGMKHHSEQDNIEILKEIKANALLEYYIVGGDLAGGEQDASMSKFSEVLQYANSINLNMTLHTGECGCIKNVHDAVALGAKRIGHGVALFQDKEALYNFKNNDVLLEICPKNNLQTKAINHIHELDLLQLKQYGIPYLINTNNRVVTQTNLIEEYELLLHHDLITIEEIERINLEAVSYTFLNDAQKQLLLNHSFNNK